jgi:predicted esterase
VIALASVLLALFAIGSPSRVDDPPRREPDPGAPAHEVFAWTSAGGLRYTWVLPEDYDPEVPRNLTVICHGTGLDYRWGHWNNKPGVFRPDDIVVSVDGPTEAQNGTRLFMGERKDAQAVRDFLHELRDTFAVERVFLYGHSQGGFFVVYFAGEYPDEVAGVAAHASGAWNWSNTGKSVRRVAIAFMHGTRDPVVPFRQSQGSRDHYAEQKFELLHLRRLANYNHWPNAVRANEVLGWAQGMTTSDPEEALAVAEELLRPKPADEYQWRTVAGFAGARDVLRRIVGDGPVPLEEVDPELVRRAQKDIDAIEQEGERHVAKIRKNLKGKELELDGRPWLGHLIAVREDFRGVDSVEVFVEEIDFDKRRDKHAKAAGKILETWYADKEPAKTYAAVVTGIDDAFLFEGFPPELQEKMEAWDADAKALGLSKKNKKSYPDFEAWAAGWKDGTDEYAKIWKKWEGL